MTTLRMLIGMRFTTGKLIFLVLNNRKLKPPKPKKKNELMEKFKEPKEFEEPKPNTKSSKHFNNWSFVNVDKK